MTTTVVGAGIAGVACSRRLQDAGVDVQVLDRGRRVGGRMAARTMNGRIVDTGASYFAVKDAGFRVVVEDWCARGLAREWADSFAVAGPDGLGPHKPGPMRYAAPAGLRSLVEDLATGLPISSDVKVEAVGPGPSVDGQDAEAVVLAMPDPQAARLLDPGTAAAAVVTDSVWEPVLAVVLRFGRRLWPADLHAVFVNDDPVLGFVADDGDRRGDGAPVLLAHTIGEYAAGHLDAPDLAAEPVVAAVTELLDLRTDPEEVTVVRWTFARPAQGRAESFFLADGIGLCGDGWGEKSRVESAWRSGDALGRALGQRDGAR